MVTVRRVASFLLLSAAVATATAQRRFVVADVETGVPIRGANVTSSAHLTDTTDWRGVVTVPDSCRTLSLSHVKYESRILNVGELSGDTIFLISRLMGLPEVTVFGQARGEDQLRELRRQLRLDKTERELAAADPASGFNLLPVLRRLFPSRKAKRRERLRHTLEEY